MDLQGEVEDVWLIDRSNGRDYLVETGRAWLANFPQPYFASNDDRLRSGW